MIRFMSLLRLFAHDIAPQKSPASLITTVSDVPTVK